jgi:hypothetical protein
MSVSLNVVSVFYSDLFVQIVWSTCHIVTFCRNVVMSFFTLLYTVTDQHYKILYQQITMLCHHKITKIQLIEMTSKHHIPIGKRNIIIFGINTISDRHHIMTGRLAIIITQHKIKTRRPPITIDKRYTHGTTTCHYVKAT